MKNPTYQKSIYFTLVGILFWAIPFFYMAHWLYYTSVYSNRNVAVETYKNTLPEFMRAGGSTNFIFILLAALALVLGVKGITNKNQFWHNLSMLVTMLSGLLAFIYLFQMM